MRDLDEQSKIVSFWDSWSKAVSNRAPADNESVGLDNESSLAGLRHYGLLELANAARAVRRLYLPRNYPHLIRYDRTLKQFQAHRSQLSAFRRAFLLYKAPNYGAAAWQFSFHLSIILPTVEIPTLEILFRYFPAVATFQKHYVREWMISHAKTHPLIGLLAFNLTLVVLLITSIIFIGSLRKLVIKYENDPEYYVWVEDPETDEPRLRDGVR